MTHRPEHRPLKGPVWVTGAAGLIGSHLVRILPDFALDATAIPLTRAELELTDFAAVRERFRKDLPVMVIHCAALSKSPICQADPALARKLNVDVTCCLAELAADIPFVFFSTDLVFDGSRGNYDETAIPKPLSVYGETKAAAEQIVTANPRHTVVRTSLNGGTSPAGNRGFNEELRNAWKSGKVLTLFTDEFRCPIPAESTARATWEIAIRGAPGIYHVAGKARLSRWQIGELIAARWPQLNPRIEPASISSYKGAPRPADTSLDCSKATRLLSSPLPSFPDWLREHPQEAF